MNPYYHLDARIDMVGIFVSGFSGMSSGSVPGTHKMADDPTIKNNVSGDEVKIGHTEHSKAISAIEDALKKDPCEPVIIIGHSFGGDTAIEIAEELKKKGICVDLLIQIDSVGSGDEKIPSNVRKGVNIHSTSGDGINGASNVEGSENIGIDNTSHTDIDENPAESQKTGSSSDPKYSVVKMHGI